MDEEYHIKKSIINFVDENKYTLMNFKGITPIHKVKCAYLKSVEKILKKVFYLIMMNQLIIIFL